MNWILLCLAGLFASFVDAVAGGGGLISIPAFILFGLPMHQALGTNKFSASCSSLTSTIQFVRCRKIDFSGLIQFVPITVLGASLGVFTAVHVSSEWLKLIFGWLILIMTLYSLFSNKRNKESSPTISSPSSVWTLFPFTVLMGFYDGFFGPGTGSLLLFGFKKILHEDYLSASGHAKLINFTSNAVSLTLFAYHGKIQYGIGILVGFFMIIGAYAGSKFAIKKGSQIIKPFFILISASLGIKLLIDYFIRL